MTDIIMDVLYFPKASGALAQIDNFYKYIKEKNIQPLNKTPTSVHVGGKFNDAILQKLADKGIPFVRSATSSENKRPVPNKPRTDHSPEIKNVIAANAEKEKVNKFKTEDGLKEYDSYYTHPHQAKDENPNYILNYFNTGIGNR